jgi:hypothetical protein
VTKKFEVKFLDEARKFLDNLADKPREKIIYNIRKAQVHRIKIYSRNLMMRFGSSEHYTTRLIIDFLHSGTK